MTGRGPGVIDASTRPAWSDHAPGGAAPIVPVAPVSAMSSGASAARSTIDALFAVGLNVSAALALVDGEAGARLDRVVDDLDAMISRLRSETA
jgi:hypothetical protein